ncbi:AAA family ATPase [Tsukamurella tyrosinosolvens]|uniref:septum site-determining protein Ssd n=1 Tax=Tsukamurella tyrosinosolvens TaxID=57704 RepID=UPI001AF201F2|nr:septum site-determining protein Ssd [Tsukamurella tyrosinosolvens]QRY85057.1 AAA family ATPase [Tsukamurella tyrosinosolvens]
MQGIEIGMAVADGALADDVRRAAAAAARSVTVIDRGRPRACWASAAGLVLDLGAATAMAEAARAGGLPRRDGVAIVAAEAGMAELAAAVEVGAAQVFVLPAQVRELARFLAAREQDDGARSRVVAVLGGHGGAGASVLAAAVAVTAPGRGITALAVDADPWGGGLDLLLGCADMPGLRWGDLALRGGHVPSDALVAALPGRAGAVAVLSAGGAVAGTSDAAGGASPPEIPVEGLLAVIDAGRRSVGVTVVDLPRRDDPATSACLEVADVVLVVVGATVRGCAAARSVIDGVARRARRVGLVVRGPAPGGLSARDVERAVGAPLLVSMRPQPGLASQLDDGGLRLRRGTPLAVAAGRVLDGVRRGAA